MDFVETQNTLQALIQGSPNLQTVATLTDQKGNIINLIQQKLIVANPDIGKKGGLVITVFQATADPHDQGSVPDAELAQLTWRLNYIVAVTENWPMNRSRQGTNIPALRGAQFTARAVHGKPNGNPAGRKLSRFIITRPGIVFIPTRDDNIITYHVNVHTIVTEIPQPTT